MRNLFVERFFDALDEFGKRQFNGAAKGVNFHDVHAPLAGLTFRDIRLRLSQPPRDFELRETGGLARFTQVLQEDGVFVGVQRFRLRYRISPEGRVRVVVGSPGDEIR